MESEIREKTFVVFKDHEGLIFYFNPHIKKNFFLVSPPSGLRDISHPITPGFTRGHPSIASSRPLVTLLNLNLNTKKHHPQGNCKKFGLSPDPKDLNYYDPRWNRGYGNRNQLKPRRGATP